MKTLETNASISTTCDSRKKETNSVKNFDDSLCILGISSSNSLPSWSGYVVKVH